MARWVKDPRTGQMYQVNEDGIDLSLLSPNGRGYTIDPKTHAIVEDQSTGASSVNQPLIRNMEQLQMAQRAQQMFAESQKLQREQEQRESRLDTPYYVDPTSGQPAPLQAANYDELHNKYNRQNNDPEGYKTAIKALETQQALQQESKKLYTTGDLQDYNVTAKSLAEQSQYGSIAAKSTAERAQYEALEKARGTGNPEAVSAYMNLYDPKQAVEIQKTNQEWINAIASNRRAETELGIKQGEYALKQIESGSKVSKEQAELQMAQQKMFNENLASSAANASAIFQLPEEVQEQAYQEYIKHLNSIGVSTAHLKSTFKEARAQLGQVIQMGNAALKGDDRRIAEMNAPQFAQTQNPYMPTDEQLKSGVMRDPNNPYAATKVAGAGVLGDTADISEDPRFQGQVGPYQSMNPEAQQGPMPPQEREPMIGAMPSQSVQSPLPPQTVAPQAQEDVFNNLSPEDKLQLSMYISSRPDTDPAVIASAYMEAKKTQQDQTRAPAEAQQAANMPVLRRAIDPTPQQPEEAGFFESLTGPVEQTKALINGVSNIAPMMRAFTTNFADQTGLPFGGTPQDQLQKRVMMDPSIHRGNGGLRNLLAAGANKLSGGITNFAVNGKPENPQLVQPHVKAQYEALGQRIAAQNAANPNTNITNTLGSALPLAAIPYVGAPLAGAVVNQPGDQAFGALMGGAIQAAPSVISKTANLSPSQIAKAEALMAKGNKLTLGQATNSRLINAAEEGLEGTPNLAGGMQQTFNNQAVAMRAKYNDILQGVPESQIPRRIRTTLKDGIEGRVNPQRVAKAIELEQFSPAFKALPDDVQKQLLDQSADIRTIWPKAETKEVFKMGGNSIPATMWGDTKKLAGFIPRAAAAQVLKYGAKPAIAIAKNGKKIKPGLQALLQYLISNNGGNQ